MRIRFLKPATAVGFGYRETEEADLPPETADLLIEKGYAEKIDDGKASPVETRESKAAPEQRSRTKGKGKKF